MFYRVFFVLVLWYGASLLAFKVTSTRRGRNGATRWAKERKSYWWCDFFWCLESWYGCFQNRGTRKSSIRQGFPLISNKPSILGTPILGNTHVLHHRLIDWSQVSLFLTSVAVVSILIRGIYFFFLMAGDILILIILPETHSSPLKISHSQNKLVFQPSIFRCYVSLREGILGRWSPRYSICCWKMIGVEDRIS